jgi:phosphate-selective porin OprO/OprP
MDALQQQILQLQQQLQSLQAQVKQSSQEAQQAQTQAAAAQAKLEALPPAAPPAPPGPHVIQSKTNQFGLASADGRNSIELTGRYMFDMGDYLNYNKNSKATSPNDLGSGVNARRARIGITGKFDNDWNYTLIYDFGGSSDTTTGTNSGAITSGIENGFIEYTGLRPLAIDVGYLDVPYTLEESMSSNDLLFIERASPQVIAASLAAGDFRSVLGGHWNSDRAWIGVFATGPLSGAAHTLSVTTLNTSGSAAGTVTSTNYGGSAEQFGTVGRASYQILQSDDYTLHVGLDAEGVWEPAHASSGVRALTLSDRPELRIDPTSLISASIPNVTDAESYSGEVAAGIGSLFFMGEYFDYQINRDTGFKDYNFQGGYADLTYTLTGEHHTYNPLIGAYNRIFPAHPFGWSDGGFTGFGAWELAARYSEVDLNDDFTLAKTTPQTAGIEGGFQRVYTVGVNWYPNDNIRFILDYLHGNIEKTNSAGLNAGQKFDAIAIRSEFVF